MILLIKHIKKEKKTWLQRLITLNLSKKDPQIEIITILKIRLKKNKMRSIL